MELNARTIRILATIERERNDMTDMAAGPDRDGLEYDGGGWQGSSDSNRGPSVLETDALTS